MTPITTYFLTRLDTSGNVQIDIIGNAYAAYQLYVDNALIAEATGTPFKASFAKNKKVDVLGISSGESGTDFSDDLDDSFGDKVEFILPISYFGKAVKIYSDHRTGVIDYGRPIAFVLCKNIIEGIGWHAFTANEWNTFTADQWNAFGADGFQQVKLVAPLRLQVGTYKFALVTFDPVNNYHQPLIVTQTITSRPDEITPYIVSYDPALDELVIGTDDIDDGVYRLYAAPWGMPKTAINFNSPLLSSSVTPVEAYALVTSHTDSTRYFVLRKTVNGQEEKNFDAFALVTIGGDWEGNYPSPPSYLRGEIIDKNEVKLSWRYQSQRDTKGFNVYSDSGDGSIDYTTVIASVDYTGDGSLSVTLPAITTATKYGVRTFGWNEESNTDFVSVSPVSLSVSLVPDAPKYLRASIGESDIVLLSYKFSTSRLCDGFHIYAGEGAVDYSDIIQTITNDGRGSYQVSLPTISVATTYAVRAFYGDLEESNTDTVTVSPLADLVAITGNSTTTWSEE